MGTLVKSTLGRQTTNGVLNQGEVKVDSAGPRARPETLAKIETQSSLRISLQRARPGQFVALETVCLY